MTIGSSFFSRPAETSSLVSALISFLMASILAQWALLALELPRGLRVVVELKFGKSTVEDAPALARVVVSCVRGGYRPSSRRSACRCAFRCPWRCTWSRVWPSPSCTWRPRRGGWAVGSPTASEGPTVVSSSSHLYSSRSSMRLFDMNRNLNSFSSFPSRTIRYFVSSLLFTL